MSGFLNIDRIGNMKNLKDPEKTLDIFREDGCFLVFSLIPLDEYHYRWIMDIIRNETGEEIKVPKKKKVKKQYLKL